MCVLLSPLPSLKQTRTSTYSINPNLLAFAHFEKAYKYVPWRVILFVARAMVSGKGCRLVVAAACVWQPLLVCDSLCLCVVAAACLV